MDISALLQKYDQPVPRYTSYPTAVHFNHDISQDYYEGLFSNLIAAQPVSLYVHIPFCHVLCHYCGCHTKVANSYGPVKSYVQTLLKEIDLVGKTLSCRPPISQLHFGGGSPNFLEEEEMTSIITALHQYFDFGEDAEIAIETDPRLLNEGKIETLAALGFTRVSLGVQDFNPDVQKAVNRIQPFETVQESVVNLRKAGINKLNFDLMTGLPLQTLESVKRSAEQAVSLCPDRLAVFAYAHVPWMKKQQKLLEKYPMPDTKERFDMMLGVKETLEGAGYHALGIDHFSHEEDSLYKVHKTELYAVIFKGIRMIRHAILLALAYLQSVVLKMRIFKTQLMLPLIKKQLRPESFLSREAVFSAAKTVHGAHLLRASCAD
jgi:oxygen-independent coproporphyrinogen-3 oxidase